MIKKSEKSDKKVKKSHFFPLFWSLFDHQKVTKSEFTIIFFDLRKWPKIEEYNGKSEKKWKKVTFCHYLIIKDIKELFFPFKFCSKYFFDFLNNSKSDQKWDYKVFFGEKKWSKIEDIKVIFESEKKWKKVKKSEKKWKKKWKKSDFFITFFDEKTKKWSWFLKKKVFFLFFFYFFLIIFNYFEKSEKNHFFRVF